MIFLFIRKLNLLFPLQHPVALFSFHPQFYYTGETSKIFKNYITYFVPSFIICCPTRLLAMMLIRVMNFLKSPCNFIFFQMVWRFSTRVSPTAEARKFPKNSGNYFGPSFTNCCHTRIFASFLTGVMNFQKSVSIF